MGLQLSLIVECADKSGNNNVFGLQGSTIKGSVIGCNTFVGNGCHIEDTLLMGNDNYSNDRERERARSQGLSVLGIGEFSIALWHA